MHAITRLALPLIASFAFLSSSQAATIVDTGSVAGTYYNGYGLGSNQWLGAQFQLGKNTTISGINGWMSSPWGGNVQMNVASIVNGMPATALFSTKVSVAAGMDQAWVGASGLSWNLAAGTYALTFTPAQGFNASMAFNAPSSTGPMFYTSGNSWYTTPGSMGMQIFGAETVAGADVPEPASIALFGLALAGLAASRRKRA